MKIDKRNIDINYEYRTFCKHEDLHKTIDELQALDAWSIKITQLLGRAAEDEFIPDFEDENWKLVEYMLEVEFGEEILNKVADESD